MKTNARSAVVVGAFLSTFLSFLFLASVFSRADEGMYLYFDPPLEIFKDKYGVELTPEILENLQKSCLRFSRIGSASFVSSNGLVMTNFHVGEGVVRRLKTDDFDPLKTGYVARSLDEEIRCPNLKLYQLEKLVDVTDSIRNTIRDAAPERKQELEQELIKKITKQAEESSGLTCDVKSYYGGALYLMYQYKVFDDARLVFIPEKSVGFFGGDIDDFKYPRYNLDVCFFRVYENGQPYRPQHYLKWSDKEVAEGDFTLVSGHPASTDRYKTVAELEFLRDVEYPVTLELARINTTDAARYNQYLDEIFDESSDRASLLSHGMKNLEELEQCLRSENVMRPKREAEEQLRRRAKELNLFAADDDPWIQIENAYKRYSEHYLTSQLLVDGFFANEPFSSSLRLIEYLELKAKADPNDEVAQRDIQFHERVLADVKSPQSIDTNELSAISYASQLETFYEFTKPTEGGRLLGSDFIPQATLDLLFGGVSPKASAMRFYRERANRDGKFYAGLFDADLDSLRRSDDVVFQILFAFRDIIKEAKESQKFLTATRVRESPRIEEARYRVYGNATFPDADFTLRLSPGVVKSYTADDGEVLEYRTTTRGTYERAESRNYNFPYDLPQSWLDALKISGNEQLILQRFARLRILKRKQLKLILYLGQDRLQFRVTGFIRHTAVHAAAIAAHAAIANPALAFRRSAGSKGQHNE